MIQIDSESTKLLPMILDTIALLVTEWGEANVLISVPLEWSGFMELMPDREFGRFAFVTESTVVLTAYSGLQRKLTYEFPIPTRV